MKRRRPPCGLPRLKLKLALRARDGAWCCFCKQFLYPSEATLEHVIPFSQGGNNELDNLRLSCAACNHERGVTPFWQYTAVAARKAPVTRRLRRGWERSWGARPWSNPWARPQRLTAIGLALIAAGFVPISRIERSRMRAAPILESVRPV
jgi:hypothetical protein